MSKMLKTQELQNAQQAIINSQQGQVISRLEAALISLDQKCKQEVLETGKNILLPEFLF